MAYATIDTTIFKDDVSLDFLHDPLHSYYLHHTKSPRFVLVSFKLIGGENYGALQADILDALFVKNKIGFIDGSIPRPSEDNV